LTSIEFSSAKRIRTTFYISAVLAAPAEIMACITVITVLNVKYWGLPTSPLTKTTVPEELLSITVRSTRSGFEE
jgi:hypothetical protein